MTLTAVINPVVPPNLLFPLQRVIFPQSRQSAKYRIVTHNFTNDNLTNGKSLVINDYNEPVPDNIPVATTVDDVADTAIDINDIAAEDWGFDGVDQWRTSGGGFFLPPS